MQIAVGLAVDCDSCTRHVPCLFAFLPFTDSSTHLQACVLLAVQGNYGNCTVATAQGDTIFAVAV